MFTDFMVEYAGLIFVVGASVPVYCISRRHGVLDCSVRRLKASGYLWTGYLEKHLDLRAKK